MTHVARHLFAVFLCCLWWCVWAAGGAQAAPLANESPAVVEMQPGQTYREGTRVHIPKGSASFLIPPGWHAQLPEDSDAIIIVSEAGAGFIMVFMILNMTEAEIMELLAEPQSITHDLVFKPVGPVAKRGNRLTAAYEAGSLSGRALTVRGPDHQSVLFFLGRPHTESSEPDQLLEDLAHSTEFAEAR